jgi:predicted nucleic acid-binding Zn ribbon protein
MGSKGEPGGRERLDEVKEQRTVGAVAYTVAPVCAQLLATLNDALNRKPVSPAVNLSFSIGTWIRLPRSERFR